MRIGDDKFKKLRARWYEKLRQDGFQDAEEFTVKGELKLKKYSLDPYACASEVTWENKRRYYELLGQALASTPPPNEVERRIMELHAEGKLNTEIQKALWLERIHRDVHTIGFVIRRWEHRWQLRNWSRVERGLKI